MAAPTLLNLLKLVSLMVAAAMVANPVEADPNNHMTVRIQNNLPGILNVHCFSRDDDLKLQALAPKAQYMFNFQLNFWGTTLFYCNFNFVGTNMWQAFDVWRGPGIWGTKKWPCRYCFWVVDLEGFWRAEEWKPVIIIHPWRKDHQKYLTP